jgi:hypothetical protein
MADPENLDREAMRLSPHLIVCNTVTDAVRESTVSWVELEVRPGLGDLDATMKVDERTPSRARRAEIGDVLAALDETEGTLRRA